MKAEEEGKREEGRKKERRCGERVGSFSFIPP